MSRARKLVAAFALAAIASASAAESFIAASVKLSSVQENLPGAGGLGPPIPSGPVATLSLPRVTLKGMLVRAYSLRVWQVVGPSWIESTWYDVTAKVPPGARPPQIAVMLQNLLAERFDLRLRWETKLENGWALVQGPPPLKLTPTTLAGEISDFDPDGVPGRTAGFTVRPGVTTEYTKGTSMEGLAKTLWAKIGDPVQNMTGIKGAYDFTFESDRENPIAKVAPADMRKALRPYGLDLVRQKVQTKTLRIESANKTPKSN